MTHPHILHLFCALLNFGRRCMKHSTHTLLRLVSSVQGYLGSGKYQDQDKQPEDPETPSNDASSVAIAYCNARRPSEDQNLSSGTFGSKATYATTILDPSGQAVDRRTSTRATSAHVVASVHEIEAFQPSDSTRYNRDIAINRDDEICTYRFPALTTLTINEDSVPTNWHRYVQGEGQPYFINYSSDICYVTEANLFEGTTRTEIEGFIQAFNAKYGEYKATFTHSSEYMPSTLPKHVEVTLQIDNGKWEYYMIDLDRKLVFWIDDCVMDGVPPQFRRQNYKQLRGYFQHEFWKHVEFFPCHRPIVAGVLDEIQGSLIQMYADVTTSRRSTTSFTKAELEMLIPYAGQMITLATSNTPTAHTLVAWASARIMGKIVNAQFLDFYGLVGARLNSNRPIYGIQKKKRRSLLNKIFSFLLFFAPEEQLDSLEDIYIDSWLKTQDWKAFEGRMGQNLVQYDIAYAALLLNANLAHLSIPSVEYAASVASIASMIICLGSIITGLLLLHQQRQEKGYTKVLKFLRLHKSNGIQILAVVYCLPHALFLWGMLVFVISVALNCFDALSINKPGIVSMYSIIWLLVVLLVIFVFVTTIGTDFQFIWFRRRGDGGSEV